MIKARSDARSRSQVRRTVLLLVLALMTVTNTGCALSEFLAKALPQLGKGASTPAVAKAAGGGTEGGGGSGADASEPGGSGGAGSDNERGLTQVSAAEKKNEDARIAGRLGMLDSTKSAGRVNDPDAMTPAFRTPRTDTSQLGADDDALAATQREQELADTKAQLVAKGEFGRGNFSGVE